MVLRSRTDNENKRMFVVSVKWILEGERILLIFNSHYTPFYNSYFAVFLQLSASGILPTWHFLAWQFFSLFNSRGAGNAILKYAISYHELTRKRRREGLLFKYAERPTPAANGEINFAATYNLCVGLACYCGKPSSHNKN